MLHAALLLAQLVVVSDPADSYRPLADEIAREEHTTIASSWIAAKGEFLVWVVEPGRLSDHVIASFARDWRDRFPETAVGIITARTLDQARALWRRARQVRASPAAAFDVDTWFPDEDFTHALSTGAYVTFAGHGGASWLRLPSGKALQPDELPSVANLILSTASCNTFRPWADNSIALALVEKGAAAFTGFSWSPESGFTLGGNAGLPFLCTYPDFPIGRVVQLQNRAAMRAFAALPFYFLLGDPRISLAREQPWSLTSDTVSHGGRHITIHSEHHGLIPVRIRGAAAYHYTAAAGAVITEPSFYNSRLETLDAHGDKFILVHHTGGELALDLRRSTALWEPLTSVAVQSLDTVLVFFPSAPQNCVVALIPGLAIILFLAFRRVGLQALFFSVAAGLILGALHLAWIVLRDGRVSAMSKNTDPNVLVSLVTAVLCGAASARYFTAEGKRGRVIALLAATFPTWSAALLHFAFTSGMNLLVFRPRVGASVYSSHMAQLADAAFAITLTVVAVVFEVGRRLFPYGNENGCRVTPGLQ